MVELECQISRLQSVPKFQFCLYMRRSPITASGNISANGNLCFRVFVLQLKVINKNICYLYSVRVDQIN